MSNIHIKSLHIQAFRGIKDLVLSDFTGINIFTGGNNSGKTSVLEVLQTSGDPHSPTEWTRLRKNKNHSTPTRTVFESIKDLYPVSEKDLNIAYSKEDDVNGASPVRLHASVSSEKTIMREYCRIANIDCEPRKEYAEAQMIKLSGSFDAYNITRFDIFAENGEKPYNKYNVLYISPTEYRDECPIISEVFSNNETHTELINVLQLFDSDILDIAPPIRDYEIPYPINSGYQVRSKKYGKLMPLAVYGDGMKKALWLVTAILISKNGVLLIDEFETAIHASVMAKLFSWMFKACKIYNVQLFMTTHSKEALQKVMALHMEPDLQNEITLYTLYKQDKNTVARRLSAQEAYNADNDFGMELR